MFLAMATAQTPCTVHVAASARVVVAAYGDTGLSVCLSYERESRFVLSVKWCGEWIKVACLKTLEPSQLAIKNAAELHKHLRTR